MMDFSMADIIPALPEIFLSGVALVLVLVAARESSCYSSSLKSSTGAKLAFSRSVTANCSTLKPEQVGSVFRVVSC